MARIEAEEKAIARKLGFRDLDRLRRHIRADRGLHARSRADILERYRRHTDEMWKKLPTLFTRLPARQPVIAPIEDHLQVSIQQQLPELPPARQQANVGAFSEGWGLYAERLVVDTGLHARRWTRERVIAYFREHSSLDEPAQALSYKIGELTIARLRERARAELGAAFDLRAFHDEVLGGGALPLDILEARVVAWIARQRR